MAHEEPAGGRGEATGTPGGPAASPLPRARPELGFRSGPRQPIPRPASL